jgi:histidyl-tRNA synthetase
MAQGPLPGFRDFYPPELAERAHLMRIWRDVARRFAFVEYDGPPLEPLELYTRKSGEEIVAQLYNFTDKGGREVALRPEMTPTFARMVAAKVQSLRKPVRWFSIPQLFRYERQQKGRLREHFQLNVDIVGEPDITADAELLAVAIEVMRACGLTSDDVEARVSDRRLLNAVLDALGFTEHRSVAYAALDKLRTEPRAVLERRLTDAGVSAASAAALLELGSGEGIDDLPTRVDRLRLRGASEVDQHLDQMERYLSLLAAHGVADWVRFDLSIVRGLAYYTGTVFELYDRKGEFRAICGGGRYDDLLSAVGGPSLPAAGFGMGDVVLAELLRARGLMRIDTLTIDYWVATDDNDLLSDVLQVASRLRARGHTVEYALRRLPLARQLRVGDAAGARHVVILKRDRWPQGTLVVRNLGEGTEREIRLEELLGQK